MIPSTWLTQKFTGLAELKQHYVDSVCEGVPAEEQAGLAKEVEEEPIFGQSLRPGDELWQFNSGKKSRAMLGGRAGYALVRAGQVVDIHTTRMG